MAISESHTGSATIGTTVYYLASASTTATPQTTDGVYQLFIDLENLAAGDIVQVCCWEKVTAAGSFEKVWIDNVTGPLDSPHYVTPSLVLMHGWEFSLAKITGTDRTLSWSIRKIG